MPSLRNLFLAAFVPAVLAVAVVSADSTSSLSSASRNWMVERFGESASEAVAARYVWAMTSDKLASSAATTQRRRLSDDDSSSSSSSSDAPIKYIKMTPDLLAGILTGLLLISLAIIGLCSMPIGTFADFSSHRLLWWKVMALLAFISNACMMITGPNYLWVASLVFGGLTACFTDLVSPIRNSFYEDITTDQASRGYIGAMRQFSSYSALGWL